MKDKFTIPILTLVLLLFPIANSKGQSSQNANLPDFPGLIRNPERGVNPGIVSGSHSGYYIRIGEDIGLLCSKYGTPLLRSPAQYKRNPMFRLNVFDTEGSLESLKRLRKDDDVHLAIVQSDLGHYARHLLNGHKDIIKTRPNSEEARILKSWDEILKNTALIIPLYDEKIHIVVRHDDGPNGKNKRFKDLKSLFTEHAHVNIGTMGSGTMVTSTMISETVTNNNTYKELYWEPHHLPAGQALENLLNPSKHNDEFQLDAVILVGGAPYPALEKWTDQLITDQSKKKSLFKEVFIGDKIVPRIELLPFGDADAAFNNTVYKPSVIEGDNYILLRGQNPADVPTRAVKACLVTHKLYTDKAAREEYKIKWVRHIVYRILSKLHHTEGLQVNFSPRGQEQWKEAGQNIIDMKPVLSNTRELTAKYGWELHPDTYIRNMLRDWDGIVSDTGMTTTRGPLIDPERDIPVN